MRNTLKAYILIVVTFLAIDASAQIEKGKWMAGPGFSLAKSTYESPQHVNDTKGTTLDVDVSIGRMVTSRIALGAELSYGRDLTRNEYAVGSYQESVNNFYGASVYGQGFYPISKNLYYSPKLLLGLQNGKTTFREKGPGADEVKNTAETETYLLELAPVQLAYALNKRLLLQAGFGQITYSQTEAKTDATWSNLSGSSTGLVFRFSPNLSNIGISFVF